MTPCKALNIIRKRGNTLEEIRILLGKSGVKTSVPTLWRIAEVKDYQASYKLASKIIHLEEATR